MERSFDPIHALKLARRWAPLVVFMVLLGGGLAFVVARSATSMYQACGLLRVAPGAAGSGQTAAPVDTQTDAVLLIQNSVLDQVIRDLRLRATHDQLREVVAASAGPSTELITTCATEADAAQAAAIANAVMSEYAGQVQAQTERAIDQAGASLQSQIQKLEAALTQENSQVGDLQRSHQDTSARLSQIQSDTATLNQLSASYSSFRAQQGLELPHVSVAAQAAPPAAALGKHILTDSGIGAVAGLLIGIAIAVILQLLDLGLRTEEDIREKVGIPVLGVIPSYSRDAKAGAQLRAAAADEAFRSLRTSLLFTGVERAMRSVVVTSARVGEGKTRTAANLAAVLGAAGARVLLVDADLRRPNQHLLFHRSMGQGLSELLLSVATTGAPPDTNGASKTRFANLSLLSAGAIPPNPSELLASRAAELTLRWLEHSYDTVVIDTPPIDAVTDALPIAAEASATILVVETGATSARQLQRVVERLRETGANVVGVVLNKSRKDPPREYLDYYYAQHAPAQADTRTAETASRRTTMGAPVANTR